MFSPPQRQGHRIPQEEPQTLDWMKLEAPGLSQAIDIPFPDRKLPVCEVCKKNYKTRELCRARDGHTDLPWTKTFICITFEESCFDSDGNLRNRKITAKSLSTPQPYCYKKDIDSTTPICSCCKEKNYTRQYCREKLRHRQLPWGTVYVSLSIDRKELKKIVKEDSSTRRTSKEGLSPGLKRNASSDGPTSPLRKKIRKSEEDDTGEKLSTGELKVEEEKSEDEDVKNIFSKIDESRTFLAVVSSQSCEFEWLNFDKTAQPSSPSNQSPRQKPPPHGDQYYDPLYNPYRGYYNYPPMYRISQPPYPPAPPQPGFPSQPHQRDSSSSWYGYQPYSPQGQPPQPLHYQSSYPQHPYYPNMPPNPGMYHDQQPPPSSQYGGSGYPHPQSSPGPPQSHSSQYWQQHPQSSLPVHQHRQPPPPPHPGYNMPPGYSHHPGPQGSPPPG